MILIREEMGEASIPFIQILFSGVQKTEEILRDDLE
jgi:hypothetical protein